MNTLLHKPVAFLHSCLQNSWTMKKLFFAYILSFFAVAAVAQPSLQEGIRHLENENYKGALDIFNAIAKADPRNGTVYYYIGEVSYVQDNPAEAEKAYKKGLSINPQCAECKVGIGKIALDKGDKSAATENFESAARLDKKNANTFALIGESYLSSKNPDAQQAIKYFGEARDMNTKVARYWARLGDAYKMSGDNGEAMTHFETAVEKDPNNTAAYISMARIWAAAKQYDLAIEKLNTAIKLSPDDAPPYKDLIELYIQTGEYDKVTPLLTKYTTLTGTDVDAKVRLVKFLTFQAKDYDRAIQEGEALLKTNPEQYTLHRWLAWAYGEKGMAQESYDHSVKLFDAIEKNKDERKAFTSDYDYWAKAAMKLGNLDEAAHVYRKYIEFEPSKAMDIYTQLAEAYYKAKNYEQAIAYYERRNELKALTNAEEYSYGISLWQADRILEADSSFARAIVISPDWTAPYIMRAKMAIILDSTETKRFLAKDMYVLYLDKVNLITDAATKDKQKKNIIDASIYLAGFWIHGAPDNAELKAKVEAETGQKFNKESWEKYCYSKAIEHYNLALELEPTNVDIADNLKKLKEFVNR